MDFLYFFWCRGPGQQCGLAGEKRHFQVGASPSTQPLRPLPIGTRWAPIHLFDNTRLGVDDALTDIECSAQVRRRHVRRKRFVVEKIYPPKNIDDAARPRSRLAGSNWTRALSAKRPGHCTRQVPVFVVEMPVANIVGQADNFS